MIVTVFGVGVATRVTRGVIGWDDGLSVGAMQPTPSLAHLPNGKTTLHSILASTVDVMLEYSMSTKKVAFLILLPIPRAAFWAEGHGP